MVTRALLERRIGAVPSRRILWGSMCWVLPFALIGLVAGWSHASEFDALECFRIRDALKLVGTVTVLSRQFGLREGCRVKGSRLLCVPASTDFTEVTARKGAIDPTELSWRETGHRLCYAIECKKPALSLVEVTDPFGRRMTKHPRSSLLCLPAIVPQIVAPVHDQQSHESAIALFPLTGEGDVAPSVTTIPPSPLGFVSGISVGPTGEIYVLSELGGRWRIVVWDVASHGESAPSRTIEGDLTMLGNSVGIAVDKDGIVYAGLNSGGLLDGAFGGIVSFDGTADGNVAPRTVLTGNNTGLVYPEGLAFDSAGNLYVVDLGAGAVFVFPAGASGNTAPVTIIQGDAAGLVPGIGQGIAVDSDGYIYVSVFREVRVFAPGSSGNVAPVATLGGSSVFDQPTAIAVDAAGRVIVSDTAGSRIVIFEGRSGSSQPLAVIQGDATGLSSPFGIALTPALVDGMFR